MTNIASKNLYDLLGNDAEQDPDREPEPPTKAIDKPIQRAGKRNAGAEGPASGTSRPRGGGRGGRSEVFTGSEQAFRDRDAGRFNNRSKPADDGVRQDRHPDRLRDPDSSGFGRGRGRGGGRGGGRGVRSGAPRDDRHSKTGIAEHDKQAAHGWGGQSGGDEWADERAGEAIAKEEGQVGFDTNVGPPVNAEGEEFKPDISGEGNTDTWAPDTSGEEAKLEPEEDKTMSYATYLAEQAEKKLSLGLGELEARKPNEGRDKKFPEGKAFARAETEENYMAGSGGKAGRTREKKEKTRVQLDDERLLKAPELGGGRGGRGGRGRGDSFRGEGGGGRGSGRGRGDRGDRGDHRGDRRGDHRGGSRGFGGGERGGGRGRGGRGGGNVNVNDQSAFPSLGS